ncbi:MAG: glycosyltransferase family 2 protein [Oligoflexia bacterium]|nr:glycosyltransferase family 2 protein [Oligoflexia bacterium]
MDSRPSATFLIPCLNEERTLGELLRECSDAFKGDTGVDWEVLVADNGSTDRSREIAREGGARVVEVMTRGYGAALGSGILNAETEWVVYADADGTYRPRDAVALVKMAVRQGADLVLGSRLAGEIEPGAMPWTHRYLGTPVLSWLIRSLYGVPITDCNSGIRCLRRESYLRWKLRSAGMEFASALLIQAANRGARILETPVVLRAGPPGRTPHLKSWRDGMRHLLVILAGAPWFFWYLGLALLAGSLVIAVPCIWGPFPVFGDVGLFGPHTLAVGTVVGFYGAMSFSMALLLYVSSPTRRPQPALSQFLTRLPEDVLFWALVFFSGTFLAGGGYLFWRWYLTNYGGLDFVRLALFCVYLTVIPMTLLLGIFQAHLWKRTQ